MRLLFAKIISLILVIATIISVFGINVVGSEMGEEGFAYYYWLAMNDQLLPFLGGDIKGSSTDYCNESSDNHHHNSTGAILNENVTFDDYGVFGFISYKCDYCNTEFPINPGTIKNQYQQNLIPENQEVEVDPETGELTTQYLKLEKVDEQGDYWYLYHGIKFLNEYPEAYIINNNEIILNKSIVSTIKSIEVNYITEQLADNLKAPQNGRYRWYLYQDYTQIYDNSSNTYKNNSVNIPGHDIYYRSKPDVDGGNSNASNISAGYKEAVYLTYGFNRQDRLINEYFNFTKGTSIGYKTYKCYTGKFNLKIYAVCDPFETVNPINTIGNITGDVVVIGDDNEINYYKDVQFVDETNNQFYDIQNNNWITYNSYSYDYSTMTYNFTIENGDTYTINYGDEYITYTTNVIVEGDTIINNYYYYYYIEGVDGGGDENEDTSAIIAWLEKIYNKLKELVGLGGGGSGGGDEEYNGQSWFSWLKDRFQNTIGSLWDTITSFIADIIGGIIEFLLKIVTSVSGFVMDNVTGFFDILEDFFGGMDVFDGSNVTLDYQQATVSPDPLFKAWRVKRW